jgi:hypothetical protein
MKDIILAIVLLVVALVCFISIEPTEHYYDCSLAEFHPDYPKEVREQCRALRQQPKTSIGITI